MFNDPIYPDPSGKATASSSRSKCCTSSLEIRMFISVANQQVCGVSESEDGCILLSRPFHAFSSSGLGYPTKSSCNPSPADQGAKDHSWASFAGATVNLASIKCDIVNVWFCGNDGEAYSTEMFFVTCCADWREMQREQPSHQNTTRKSSRERKRYMHFFARKISCSSPGTSSL